MSRLYIHECLHMSQFFSRIVEEELVDHPWMKETPECQKLAEEAAQKLAELYQLIGQHVPDDD